MECLVFGVWSGTVNIINPSTYVAYEAFSLPTNGTAENTVVPPPIY